MNEKIDLKGMPFKIGSPAELRAILLQTMVGVVEGRCNVSQANAVVGLSGEVHKSIRQEWDMRVYAAENLTIHQARILCLGVSDAD